METRKLEMKENMDIYYLSKYIEGVEEACAEKIIEKDSKMMEEGKYDSKESKKNKEKIEKDNSLKELSLIKKNISEIEMLEQKKSEIKELKRILKVIENRAISKIIEKELNKIYVEEDRRIKDSEKIIEGIKKGQSTKYAIFDEETQYMIVESDKSMIVPKDTFKKLCKDVIQNVKNKNSKQKSTEIVESEKDNSARYIEKELEEIEYIKEFFSMEIPSEIIEKIKKEDPKKMQKYIKMRTEGKREVKVIEKLYSDLGKNKEKIYKIKEITNELNSMKDKIPENIIENIKKQLYKQEQREHKKEERLQQKIERRKNKKSIARSISSISRYKKIIEINKVSARQVISIEEIKKEQKKIRNVANKKLEEVMAKGEYIPEETQFYEKNGDVYSQRDEEENEIVSGGYYTNQQEINKARSEKIKIEEETETLIKEAEKNNEEILSASVELEEMWKAEINFMTSNEKNQKAFPSMQSKVDKNQEFRERNKCSYEIEEKKNPTLVEERVSQKIKESKDTGR